MEGNGRIQVKAIHARLAARQLLPYNGGPVQLIGKRLAAEVPGTYKVIFRAGSHNRGRRLSVNEEHVVPFSPPEVMILQHRHGYSDILPMPCRLPPYVLPLPA